MNQGTLIIVLLILKLLDHIYCLIILLDQLIVKSTTVPFANLLSSFLAIK